MFKRSLRPLLFQLDFRPRDSDYLHHVLGATSLSCQRYVCSVLMAQAKKGNARAAAKVLREFLDAESTEAVAWVGFAWGEMCGREGDLSDGDVNEALIHASRELAAQSGQRA